ncbi:MAG: response regulator [Candidatus Aenigmatarchaeota archaeon]
MADKKKILVVDDSDTFAGLIKDYLEPQHEVSTVGNGISGLNMLRCAEPPYDLGLIDFVMPGINGIKLITIAKGKEYVNWHRFFQTDEDHNRFVSAYKDIPLVLCTSTPDNIDIYDSAIRAGATEVIGKSFNHKDFFGKYGIEV